jgi:hypothetical protein
VFFAPAASHAAKKARELVTTGTPNIPAFPARWFYGFLRDLLGEPGFLATVAAQCEALTRVDISVGISGPHDFAVRFGPRSSHAQKHPPHPAPTFVTIAIRPSSRARDARKTAFDLPDAARQTPAAR